MAIVLLLPFFLGWSAYRDVCWNYYTDWNGYSFNAGAAKCASEGSGLMILENAAKFQFMTNAYMSNIYYNVYGYEIWVGIY